LTPGSASVGAGCSTGGTGPASETLTTAAVANERGAEVVEMKLEVELLPEEEVGEVAVLSGR
jgi:hypothetical protein